MKNKLLAALCALLMMAATAAGTALAEGDTLDLSLFEDEEPSEAAQWEELSLIHI